LFAIDQGYNAGHDWQNVHDCEKGDYGERGELKWVELPWVGVGAFPGFAEFSGSFYTLLYIHNHECPLKQRGRHLWLSNI